MHEINYEEVKLFIETNSLQFNPGQKKISYPIIARIHRRLQEGHRFNTIKVQKTIISDGHHRFISLCLLNMEVSYDLAGENTTKQEPLDWKDVELAVEDYDTHEQKEEYAQRYDKVLKDSHL